MSKSKIKPIHSMLKEVILEELQAREWGDDAPLVIARLARVSDDNARRLLRLDNRLTGIECMILDRAFGTSDGFFQRLQDGFEERYPERGKE